MSHKERVAAIEQDNPRISIYRQTQLLDISRGSVYYEPMVDEEDVKIMHRMDEIFTEWPIFGSRKMKAALDRDGIHICREHAQRLMHVMGLEAIYPKKSRNTSISDNTHRTYPYLLRGIPIVRPNQVWGTDITYVRLENGWAYLVAIIDWFSRYALAWELSLTLESDFCVAVLKRALTISVPEIHNSDQGKQFTARDYTGILEERNVQISMDGRGRCFDNIFTERLWRSVKYEYVYLYDRRDVHEMRQGLGDYFTRYNTKRPHQSLSYRTPAEVYFNL